jgi:thioesterase domain-containing protein
MDHAIRQIDAHCGDQPVCLIGYSFGGLYAHAVALRLVELGRRVDFVAFLDTDARLTPTTVQAAQTQFAGRWQYLVEAVLDLGRTVGAIPRKQFTAVFSLSLVRFLTSPVGRRVLPLLARYRHRRLPIRFGYFLHRYLNEALEVGTLESWRWSIVKQPKALALPAYLFRSEAHAAQDPADLGWRSHFPAVKVISSKGAHNTMLDPPNLDELCDELERAVVGAPKAAEKLAIYTA